VNEEAVGQWGLSRQKKKTKEEPTGRRDKGDRYEQQQLEKRSHGVSDTILE
jgi:hypothetical protein